MKNIAKRRKQLGLSVAQLSQSSGVPQPLLRDIERGRIKASRETLKKLAGPLYAEVGDFTYSCRSCDGTGYECRPSLTWRD